MTVFIHDLTFNVYHNINKVTLLMSNYVSIPGVSKVNAKIADVQYHYQKLLVSTMICNSTLFNCSWQDIQLVHNI